MLPLAFGRQPIHRALGDAPRVGVRRACRLMDGIFDVGTMVIHTLVDGWATYATRAL